MNCELGVGGDGLLCLIFGITAVSSHVVTRLQNQDQFSSHTPIKGRLLQCISHGFSVLKQDGCYTEKYVHYRHTVQHTAHANLEPGQSPKGIASSREADETDRGPWMKGDTLRRSIDPNLLRRVCCKRINKSLKSGRIFSQYFTWFFLLFVFREDQLPLKRAEVNTTDKEYFYAENISSNTTWESRTGT